MTNHTTIAIRRSAPRLAAAFGLLLAATSPANASSVATWTGGAGDGLWLSPTNWSPGVVPLNDESDTYTVIIPGTPGVTLNSGLAEAIDSLSFDGNGDLFLTNETALDVIGVSLLAAHVTADGVGSEFTSDAFGANLLGNARLHALNGGHLRVNAGSYAHLGLAQVGSATIMSADGAGSLVDLSSLSSFTDNFNDVAGVGDPEHWHTIDASNGGVVDLSNSTVLVGSPGNDRLRVRVRTGGFIDLAAVDDVQRRTRFEIDVPFYEMPSVLHIPTSVFDIRAGATFSVPVLETIDSSVMLLEVGATLTAASLESFTRSTMTLDAGEIFDAPALLDIDGSRIQVNGGASFVFTNSAYDNTLTSDIGTTNVFSAVGAGALVDFSSLVTYTDNRNDAAGVGDPTNTRSILAADGGLVDMSGVTTLVGAAGNDRFRLDVNPGGTIDLSSLASLQKRNRIDLDEGTFTLPSLTSAENTIVYLGIGATLELPLLPSLPGSGNGANGFTLEFVSRVDAPVLETLDWANITLPPGGHFDAPSLHTYTNAGIVLAPGANFETAPLTQIDGSRFHVIDGVQYAVADTEYVNTFGVHLGAYKPFLAMSANSLIDLTSVLIYRDNFDDGAGVGNPTNVRTNHATTGGTIDLSNATLLDINPGNDILRFTADAGGTIKFGDTNLDGRIGLIVDGDGSAIEVGTPILDSTVTISLTDAGRLTVSGDLVFPHTNEANFSLHGGVFHFDGGPEQRLEVAGEDLGPGAFLDGNFGIGQLVVGSDQNPVTLRIADSVDNGNRFGETPEALYVYGLPADGLSILGGSTLLLPQHLNLYAAVDDEMVHINTMFTEGVTEIPFDEGTIRLQILGDLDGDGIVGFTDLILLLGSWGMCPDPPAECPADLDGNGVVDFSDLLVVLASWS